MSGGLLVVGSVAFDHVRTPHGEAEEALGGAATYFSVAATVLHKPVLMVGVVGDDFPPEVIQMLEGRGVDCRGLERTRGKTFRWKGYYEGDMNSAVTEATHLNVFGDFRPSLPPAFKKPDYLFLANIDPDLQLDVLKQVDRPRTVAADTMNFWISSKLASVKKMIAEVDILFLNDGESMLLTGEKNVLAAARAVLRMGPRVAVIKKGAHGAMIVSGTEMVLIPAVPLETVVDPTGAGDSFGGGLMAALARDRADHTDFAELRNAGGYASVIASFNCESFSMGRLQELTVPEVEERLAGLRRLVKF